MRLFPAGIVAAIAATCACGVALAGDSGWPVFGGDPGGSRFSPLRQINSKNVKDLTVAWVYRTGDATGNTPIECTPLVVDGTMYLVTSAGRVAALDPATGIQRWSHATNNDANRSGHQRASRGVAFWCDSKNRGESRILYGTPDGRLVSLDAKTGKPDPQFRTVDLRSELGPRWKNAYVGVSAAPTIYQDLVTVGIASGEDADAAPGHIMAFDVRTGKRRWNFDVISGAGGAGAWNGYVVDEKRGILFAATGSATPDFDGSNRPGNNLYANCVLALNAATGKLIWHFQTVHHDLWDHDNASAPVLCRVRRNGRNVDAVAQVTKTGYCFLFDRTTGKPLFEVREVSAPATPGGSPTQPEPILPPALTETLFTDEKITNISPAATVAVRNQLKGLSYGQKYLPPTKEGTVVAPGYLGGSPWSGASFDPRTTTLFVNTNNIPAIVSDPANYRFLVDDQGYPGIRPPWGNLTAIDLNSGQFVWRKTLGEYREITAKGIPPTGTINLGGTLATAGDLVFIGATADATFRAFNSRTGEPVFEYPLPASAYAAPMTFTAKGKQYVMIAASGGGLAKFFGFDRGPMSDTFVCFAIPDNEKGFQPIFNGKSLQGWEGDQATWRVEDGAIVAGRLDQMAPANQFLCTTATYRDFVLRMQFKIEGTEGYINGGIQVRSKRVTNPPNEVSGYQYEVDNENAGYIYDESRRNRWLTPPNTAFTQAITRIGGWNDVEITCIGNRITTKLNGYPVAEYIETDIPDAKEAGVIAVQIHGAGKTKVSYRQIRVKRMD